ncbi:laminin subunit alpha-1 isoform X2 [Temnothorax curvispinosus]|uniref:Laminin subunit alpha-1 isoform X2 n=1 Tax=Temnothorax curvispinosus TaxID=300111 RepID=A0A6J1PDD5_9HYME|nr:laminin subunit alpha-1 isoform X2 [Temnothorax curvispinosus]
MYPGKLIWVWGVLALGAGTLLLSGPQWWNESTIRTEGDGSARSIPTDESKSDSSVVFERSATKEGASYASTDGIILELRDISGDRRWKRTTRLDPRDDGSMVEETSAETSMIYEKQRVSPSINVDDRKIDGDGPSRQNLHVNEDGGTLDESSEQDQHAVIIRTDAHSNAETRASDENKPGRLAERERQRYKKGSDRAMIDIVTSSTLRNDRFEEDIAAETGSRSKSKMEDRRGLRIDVVGRGARAPRSREASINVDNYLRSSTLMLRHIQNSKRTGNHYVPESGASTSKSGDREGILEMDEKNARLGDQHKSPRISRITGAIMEIKEEITPAFSRPTINDHRDIGRLKEAEEASRSSSGERAMFLGSSERNTADGDARQFAAGMQEDQLLFFREDRERVQSSAMSPAEAIHDRKNWPGERDRGDPARKRRDTRPRRDWFAQTSSRSQKFRRRDNGIYRNEIFDKSIINSSEQNDRNNNKYNDRVTDFPIHKSDRLQNTFSKDLNSSGDSESRDENNDERSSGDAFQFLDSIIPPDNKRRKVTRGEDLKDLMVTSNFVWTSQDRGIGNRALIPEHRSTFAQDNRVASSHNGFSRKKIRSTDPRRKNARGYGGRTGETGLAVIQKADRREAANGDRRKRYTNYYSAQSVTPMAYVHIQPAYPAATPTNRKCARCMVVYKPCPSQTRPPPRIVLPSYRYHEPAIKWRGLKYGCGCNNLGSTNSACDIVSGQCQCKSHVIGRQCNECNVGYWGFASGAGCTSCDCDSMGSRNASCHSDTGVCYCKPGVGGARCNSCQSGYYGFSLNGCQLCDSCTRPGHVCDPDTGRCVCPRLTYGEHCDRCRPGAWDLVPSVGCKPCACTLGATRSQCDHQGQCPCRIGYDGLRCERCAKGYYGYPRCRPCGCSLAGTTHCRDGVCECDDKGQCPCKELVIGRKCNQCKEGTFGLAMNNVRGCTECFCFGRSTLCQQAGLSWGQRRLTRPRVLYINDTVNDVIITNFGSTTVLPAVNGGLNVTNGLSVIPGSNGDVTLPTNLYYSYPLYWRLPDSFLGDKVVSYGGFLRFKTSTEGGIPLRSNLRYPVVQLQGNNKIVLEYYLHLPVNDNHYEVRFHESLWQLQNRPDYKVSREVLMVALQNLQYILVKASDNAEFTKTTLLEASLDAAVLMPTHSPPLATGVEICQCPAEYNGTSCQDPSIGFYRWYKNTTATSTIVIDLVGQARRCQCNGRSELCDRETGYCLNCKENTVGAHCNVCADSFYGHPEFGGCKPCPCPQVDKRFSSTCVVRTDNEPICHCKPGYIGRKCEHCAYGYYGSPGLPDGKCVPCNCNLAGSLSDACDGETGQCKCRPGSTGRDCSQCTAYRHVYINNVCTSCDDNCTGILLDTVAMLSENLAEGTGHIAGGYIPPPWEALSDIDSNVTAYLEELELRTQLQQRMRNVPWHEYKKLAEDVETMLRNLNKHAKHVGTLKTKSGDLRNNVFTAKVTLDNLRKDIGDTISELNHYSNDNRKIEIKKALKTAKTILNYLKSVDIAKRTTEVENFLDGVTEYVAWLNSLHDATEPLASAQDDAKDFEIKLDDMRTVIENTMETLFSYDSLYNRINGTFVETKNQCVRIGILRDETNQTITEGQKLIDEAHGLLVDAGNNIQDLPDLRDKLTYWTEKLSMKEELLYRLNYEYPEKYVVPAVQHAKNLSSYVDQYVSLFAETRDIAASPLKASQAYKNIVDGLQAARVTALAAKESVEDVHKKVFPPSGQKSLLDDTKEVLAKSSQQWETAKEHGKLVKNANTVLDAQKQAVLVLKDTLNSTGIKDNEINVKLRELQSNSKKLHEDLLDISEDNDEVRKSVKSTQRLIDYYKQGIADRLKPKLHELKREGDSKIGLASEKLSEALSNIKKADAKLISLSNAAMKRKAVFDKWNDTLATKLQNLKDKIAEARNTAEGIRVSLRSVEGKECIRSYRPATLQPSSTTSIVITFALPTARKEGSLFYLPSGINDDFVALEIVDKKVRFLWNVGGGTGILTHPEVLESGDIQKDKFWYRIEAERTRHTGKLSVHKQSSTSGQYLPVINMTNSEYGRFDVLPTDRVWIGGIPKSQRRPTELIAGNGLPGCIHQVILDGRQIGLWNFITTAPDKACKACVEGVEDVRDDIAYSFNGEGYAVRNRVSSGPYNKYMFGVSISFRTYDENALLFLATNRENQHIMIFLREGKVILDVGYGGNVSKEISSTRKYNTGNWTKVDASRQYQIRHNIEKCSLSIDNDDSLIVVPTPQPKKEDIPDLAQAKYYIGGLPPSFRAEKLMLPSQVSFLGCMANIIVQEGYDPMAEQYYGVESSCGNKPLKIVGFYGNGYLEHSAFTLRKIQSVLSFSFRTMQDAAMLLLSTFERHRIKDNLNETANRNSYYSVCILNGQVQVRLNAGQGELVLQSNSTFNDGRYHSVTVLKKRKEVELRIDDAYQTSGRLRSSIAIKAPESNRGLFFGGLPAPINNTKMVATNTPLYGAIKDVIFNDLNLRFDDAVEFDHALIGRAGPSMGKDTPSYTPSASLSRGMSTQPEGCQKVPYYSLEPGALKFGDKPHSHTQLYLNFKKFWEKKYAIEFDFRTYYPNGLLFITPGLRLKHYLMVLIRDGQLLLVVKSKLKKEILFKTPFNDGNWHHVVISHEERKLTLLVDSQTPRVLKVPRKISLASMMYIGGLPESGTPIPEQVVVRLETLKGCIRGLKINGNVYDMVGSTSRAFNVGQCFPSVESGAYFQGEAYAVYRNNFEVDGVLELQLEFRTSEVSGVLLSITAPSGSPSLSLELNNGKVIMSGDLGDNNPLYVEQGFASHYAICDNRWHRIQAVYNDEELALKVDELDQKYGLPTNVNYRFNSSIFSGPLYIGGIPATAQKGSLLTRDHFNGCIRNVMIRGERRDWTDMAELHNIHLSSCPVQ